MEKDPFIFPPAPLNVSEEILKVSSNFRKQVIQSILAIIFFVISYLILLCLAVAFCILCVYFGFYVIIGVRGFVGLILGGGCMLVGFMTLFFLIKFIFKTNKKDLSGMKEITAADEPGLFDFITRIAAETKTKLPKKVFVTSEVNAYVFYNSSFWSLFVPVQKNLVIGLGLINSINVSELKAVIAHEFGHFSQKSMVIGSYVYNVNRILHDMLYDNEGYQRMLNFWTSISNWFVLFAYINIFIVRGIIVILQGIYQLVNLPYRKLSREMEFHADAVSAFVTGSKPLISALRRAEFAESGMQDLAEFYQHRTNIGKYPQNLFEQHTLLMKKEANLKKYKFENGLAEVPKDFMLQKANSKLRLKDLWATHPDLSDREEKLDQYGLSSEWNYSPSWVLIRNPSKLQEEISMLMVDKAQLNSEGKLSTANFLLEYEKLLTSDQLPGVFNGYYNDRRIHKFDLSQPVSLEIVHVKVTDLYRGKYLDDVRTFAQLQNDIHLLQQMIENKVKIALIEYDGEKYRPGKLKELLEELTQQALELNDNINKYDLMCYQFHLTNTRDELKRKEIEDLYSQMFKAMDVTSENMTYCDELLGMAQFIYSNPNSDEISRNQAIFKMKEKELKKKISDSIMNRDFSGILAKGEKEYFENFLNKNYVYIYQNKAVETAFQALMECLVRWNNFLQAVIQSKQRKALEFQATLM